MSFPVGIGSLGGAVFPGGTLNHSANYVISIWHPKKGNTHF